MNMTLPLPVNLGNSRMHWRTKHRKKKDFYKSCDNLMYFAGFPLPPDTGPMESVTIQATWYVHNLMDEDNAAARFKWIGDWLTTRGYIVDDKAANVRLLPPIQHIEREWEYKRVEIVITEEGT